MNKLNNIWLYVACAAIVAIVLSHGSSSKVVSKDSLDGTKESHSMFAEKASSTSPSTLPVPAQKLSKLLRGPELEPRTQESLDEKVKQLDKQIVYLDKQLQATGISLPDSSIEQTQTTTTDSEIQTRLQAIKEHIDNRQ